MVRPLSNQPPEDKYKKLFRELDAKAREEKEDKIRKLLSVLDSKTPEEIAGILLEHGFTQGINPDHAVHNEVDFFLMSNKNGNLVPVYVSILNLKSFTIGTLTPSECARIKLRTRMSSPQFETYLDTINAFSDAVQAGVGEKIMTKRGWLRKKIDGIFNYFGWMHAEDPNNPYASPREK